MSVKLYHQSLLYSRSSSNPYLSRKSIRTQFLNKKVVDLDHLLLNWGYLRKRCCIRFALLENGNLSYRLVDFRKHRSTFCKSQRTKHLVPFASADESVTVNGSPQASRSSDVEKTRIKLDQSLQGEDDSNGLVQSLHDAARVFELAIKEQTSSSKVSWFSTAWLGVDKNAWVKGLSYQASVYSLLQAASEISSREDGRGRDINIFVQRSFLRQSAHLESVIRDKLLAQQPDAYEWFWSEQVPAVVTTFVNYFERDPRFTAATAVYGKGMLLGSGNASDISLLMLALCCISAVTELGPPRISCPQFFSMIPEITGRLMDLLVDFIPISQAYHYIKDIGLHREFLVHFGPRAAECRLTNDCGMEEVVFWVGLIQNQLQRAVDREKIWSRLTTCESIEVLERDLAIFGFFIALGRKSQSFLSANGFDVLDEPIQSFVRYLIGGSVLYYPQLSSISSYQLYVEVVCEELDWLPLYPGNIGTPKFSHGHGSKTKSPPNAEAIPKVLDVCSHWMQSFIKYSNWLENPSNIKAARFLTRGHKKLRVCMEELGIQKTELIESTAKQSVERSRSGKEPDSFDKVVLNLYKRQALESVEEALIRLEELLQELHVSSSNSGKEQLKAACSDLESIRKLKKEAEFLEASFRAKAASLQQGDDNRSSSSTAEEQQYSRRKNSKGVDVVLDRSNRLWNFLVRYPTRKPALGLSTADGSDVEPFEQSTVSMAGAGSESSEIQRFELLRNELIELEKRVQRSADQSEKEEDELNMRDSASYGDEAEGRRLLQVQKKESIIGKSIDKLKETSTDVLQGTQLLAVDVAAALGLLRRILVGDELTEKEKKALQRTLTDLASVVPIGFLMLLPVTAIGHAAMLAAIQRYVPALIPSTYGPERLDLLRQLEKVKELESSEMILNPNENTEELV
ncbi:uncharacterized protein LOC132293255 isoform X2 [Cornus florida]|uniref:uncharacterized protein LOC132293255 isoform X2 n=1 Tax=Cornus florida TaxID=4283 RepID=UPI0028A00771|nr:uncharacterized protein LOC132293255 isoform X2 [Cornus florida]